MQWASTLMPLAEALSVLLGLLRDAGVPHKVVAPLGQFQQSLPQGRVYQLLRLRLPDGHDFVPEISGHRLMVSIRLMRQDAEGRLRPAGEDASFELTLCA
jgi:cell division protein ZapD